MNWMVLKPVLLGTVDLAGYQRIATDRPCDYEIGWSTEADIDAMAAQVMATNRHEAVLTYSPRRRYGDTVYDLWVKEVSDV